MRKVAAWPRCVESYGVMPHTYMRTRAGLERHDLAPRGVVEPESHGATDLPRGDASVRSRASPLWRRLTVSSAAANVASPIGFSSGRRRTARQPRIGVARSSHGARGRRRRRRPATWALEVVTRYRRAGAARARARPPPRGAERSLGPRGIEPTGGMNGVELRAALCTRPFAMVSTILPPSRSACGVRGRDGGVSRGCGGPRAWWSCVVVGRRSRPATRSPQRARELVDASPPSCRRAERDLVSGRRQPCRNAPRPDRYHPSPRCACRAVVDACRDRLAAASISMARMPRVARDVRASVVIVPGCAPSLDATHARPWLDRTTASRPGRSREAARRMSPTRR